MSEITCALIPERRITIITAEEKKKAEYEVSLRPEEK